MTHLEQRYVLLGLCCIFTFALYGVLMDKTFLDMFCRTYYFLFGLLSAHLVNKGWLMNISAPQHPEGK